MIDQAKIWLLCNPRAGTGRAERLFNAAADRYPRAELHLIEGPGHGAVIAEEAVGAGAERVVVAGGDGTLNTVAGGLINTNVSLGLVPLGSGNGYARSLGLPLDPQRALDLALTGNSSRMDVCYLNDHHFLGTAGIGFDAQVAHEFDESPRRGPFNYVRITIKQIRKAEPLDIKVKTASETYEGKAFFLCFANTTEFGNGMKISPASLPNDGLAELQVVQKPPMVQLARAMYDIYRGNALRNKHLRSIITDGATITQSGTIAHVDGEPIEVGHEIKFRLSKGAIRIVTDPV
jgi:YegS/Rv2252/BmrU family lipid kinase